MGKIGSVSEFLIGHALCNPNDFRQTEWLYLFGKLSSLCNEFEEQRNELSHKYSSLNQLRNEILELIEEMDKKNLIEDSGFHTIDEVLMKIGMDSINYTYLCLI